MANVSFTHTIVYTFGNLADFAAGQLHLDTTQPDPEAANWVRTDQESDLTITVQVVGTTTVG